MTITQAIKNFPKQFEFEPDIVNAERLPKPDKFIIAGMGGSHLAADLLRIFKPGLDLTIHSNYGLPAIAEKSNFLIASSYSGNTEETIDALKIALEKKMPAAAVSMGGELLKIAEKNKLPYIKLPDTGIQPRSAVGFSVMAILKLMGEDEALVELKKLAKTLDVESAQESGKKLAETLKGYVPVIYASTLNQPIAYNWKIRFNETGKIPAFVNVFPELNHNEMMGFDVIDATRPLSKNFHFVILKDPDDHPRIKLRMQVLEEVYKRLKLPVTVLELKGKNVWEKIFNSLLIADWAAYFSGEEYGTDVEGEESVEGFKKRLKELS